VEPRLAVDPTNPNHLVGAWQQNRWNNGGSQGIVAGVSFDAGNTWTQVVLPGLTKNSGGSFDRASDPWVSFGPTGALYVSSLLLDHNSAGVTTESGIAVSKSTNGGLSWSQPTLLIDTKSTATFNDKESITADPSNANFVYVIWDQPNVNFPSSGPAAQTFFSRSTDGGQTWSAPQVIFQSPGVDTSLAHQVFVLPNGTLVDAFQELHFSNGVFYLLDVLHSTDGGLTWSTPITAVQETPSFFLPDPLNGLFVRAGNTVPDFALDRNSGNLYAVWLNRFNNSQYTSIAFAMSSDGGFTWSNPIQINQTPVNSTNPAASSAFVPSIAVAGNGIVAVSYYDFRNQGSMPGAATDYWTVFGNPGGTGGLTNPANWGNEVRLTNASFNIVNAPNANGWFVGDYEGLVGIGKNFEGFFSQAGSTYPQAGIFAREILKGPSGISSVPSPTVSTLSFPAPVVVQQSSPPQGGFLAPASYPVENFPSALAAGDFDNDGKADLVAANESSSDVSVLLGNGNGTFQPAINSGVGKSPVAVAVGDFNHDGNLDIVTANIGSFTSNSNGTSFLGTVTVLLGNGNGTFRNAQTFILPNVIVNQVQQFPTAIAVGDFDHDGTLDFVVDASASPKGYINVFLGNGDGTFKELAPMPLNSSFPGTIAAGNFNGDSNLDIVMAAGGYLEFLSGNGDGTFRETNDLVVPAGAFDLAVGELDNDQIPDIVTSGAAQSGSNFGGTLSVLLGSTKKGFQVSQVALVPGVFFDNPALGDFNHDGIQDVVTSSFNFTNRTGAVNVFLGNGNGTIQAPLSFLAGSFFPAALAVGDFNGDGFSDIGLVNFSGNSVVVLINAANWANLAALATPVPAGSANPSSLTNVLTPSSVTQPPTTSQTEAAIFWWLADTETNAQNGQLSTGTEPPLAVWLGLPWLEPDLGGL
jgi:hypothetical protein